MTIKNKDGSVYELSKPNELMFEQTLWTRNEKFTFHNTFGQITFWPSKIPQGVKPVVPQEPKKEPRIVETRPEEPLEKNNEQKDTIKVWCLPARLEETVDPLYGEKYAKVKYGHKFLFDAIIERQSDFSISLWTNSSVVTEGSIIFPKTHDKRWWRVLSVASEDGIYNLKGTITDYQPSFVQ